MRTQPIVLTLALLVPFSAPAAPQTDEGPQPIPANHASRGPTPYVIVTTRDLRDEFVPLAREHTRLGTPAAIWTIESILPAYPAGRDDAERIRMFLQDAYRSHGARWVLIGGDDSQIPTRRVSLVKFCGDCPTLLPTDQYYACLEGSWNANGNDLWGEWPGASVNTALQLMIGRARLLHDGRQGASSTERLRPSNRFITATFGSCSRPTRPLPASTLPSSQSGSGPCSSLNRVPN